MVGLTCRGDPARRRTLGLASGDWKPLGPTSVRRAGAEKQMGLRVEGRRIYSLILFTTLGKVQLPEVVGLHRTRIPHEHSFSGSWKY